MVRKLKSKIAEHTKADVGTEGGSTVAHGLNASLAADTKKWTDTVARTRPKPDSHDGAPREET